MLQPCKTLDGSDTLFHMELQEHYHSIHGAIRESQHIFIGYGYRALPVEKDPIAVFEMGLGTGLNALLTAIAAEGEQRRVDYSAVELYPLNEERWNSLNYPTQLNHPKAHTLFSALHQCPWEISQTLSPYFSITKYQTDLLSFPHPSGEADLIYFDAFSPTTQPELWTTRVFLNLHAMLNPSGILVTYSCKGTVKRHLGEAGFRTEKLPGPPGKREILRAWKS